jgi:hypothetical protein
MEAEMILSKVVRYREINLGESHEETLLSKTLLGHSSSSLGHYCEAEILYQQVLSAREQNLPDNDESTLAIRDNLEDTLARQEKLVEWETHCRKSVAIREELAPYGYHTLRALSNLWYVLDRQQNDESLVVFNILSNKIKSLPANFMEEKSYVDGMSSEEAWGFQVFREAEMMSI